jgi:hypothetical protein
MGDLGNHWIAIAKSKPESLNTLIPNTKVPFSGNDLYLGLSRHKPRMMRKFTLILALLTISAVSGFSQINIQWASRYTSAGNNIDRAVDLARDGSGNVIVTGTSWNGSNFDIVTVKYDPAGNELWNRSFNGTGAGFDEARAIYCDAAGNVYVTGFTESTGSNYDVITIKYDAGGTQQWATPFNGTGNGFDEGYDVMADGSGNVYVTGGTYTTTSLNNYITLKYNSGGTQQWATIYSNGNTTNVECAYSMDMDGSGNVYVTGSSFGTAGTDCDVATVMYNNAGAQQWVRRFNGPGTRFDAGQDIVVSPTGEVYVCGYARAAVGITNYDALVLKYDNTATLVWSQTYNGTGNDYDKYNRLLLQSNGNVMVTGRSVGTITTAEDLLLSNYNGTSGTLIWQRIYDGGYTQYDEGKDIAADINGDVYVTGYSYNTGSNNNYITFKYDTLGNRIWEVKYNGPASNADQAYSMTVDNIGNIYLTGLSKGAGTNDDYNTIKYCQLTTTTNNDTTICLGDDVQLGATSSFAGIDTIVYSPTTYLDMTDPLNPIATPPFTMTYVVALTNLNGCTDLDTVTINVVPLPGPQIQTSGPLGFCQGDSVTLTAVDTTNGGASFTWNTSDTTASITVSTAGVYSVIITDTNTCQSQSQVTVSVYGLPNVIAGNDTGFCQSSSIVICAMGGVSYSWAPSFGVSDTTIACPTFGPTSSTTYTVTGTDVNGCSNIDSVTLSLYPLPSVPVITQNTAVLTSTPATTYQWYFNGNPIPGETNQSHTPTANGTYYVVITDTNGCSAFSSTHTMADVGINEFVREGGLLMYPNPNSGTFFIVTDLNHQAASLELISITGQVVYNEQLEADGLIRKELNAGIEDGSYIVRIALNDGTVKLGRVVISR